MQFSAQKFEQPPIPSKPPDGRWSQVSFVSEGVSFKDKVLDQNSSPSPMVKRDLVAENLMTIVYEEGKSLSYNVFKERLKRTWKLQGGFDMVDVDHGFYYVEFDLKADRDTVIGGGPWMLFDHYVAVACWTPEFVALSAKVDRTMVWIRFPRLNMVYFDESFLLGLASCIGRPVKVDTNILRVDRGRYARVCVEIDLTKPVVGKYILGGHSYKVMYEGLHVICKTCGCYGHAT
ncbi:PREDICTED: uncharacterized protein LOC109346971 [Lupinus angustifolius]|uniref:uncharacterized protein LOC109346971 n=1 Tax=Lupinus angustifolius TaxID=3871 RepID=UPI00092F99EA|nr:PREDICTED: uncharacterized protein LOC109346971 [Lupinus angustifolius]